jgi:hypothetical protein
MIAARIQDGVVIDLIIVGDPGGLDWVNSNLDGEWVDGTGGAIGDRYIDGQFVRPEQLDEIG